MTIEVLRRLEARDPQPFKQAATVPPGNVFLRWVAARVVAAATRSSVASVASWHWPSDRIVERAASVPAMTSVAGWSAELAHRVMHDALDALGPASVGAQLFKEGLVLAFDGAGSIGAPGFVAEYGNAGWIAEGDPIPVRQLASTAAVLNPHKLAAIAVLSRELVESSNAEAAIADVLVRAAGRMLDEVLFDANPEAAARPKGLRNGVSAVTPSSAADGFEAMFEDVATLVNAVAPVAGNGPYAIVGSPGRAAMMRARFTTAVPGISIYGSSAVVNDLLCVAPAALVAALSPDPVVETANASTLVMDTAPGAAGTGAEKGLFQTDSLAVKIYWPVTWALRDPRGFAWLTPSWK